MAAMRVLFDTSVIGYWLSKEMRFQPQLKKALADLRRKAAVKYISVVTVQELEVWARHGKGDALEKLQGFLSTQFSPPLILDHACAKLAAQLAASTPRKPGISGAERREITEYWQRDASIAATAHMHGMDALVTANVKDFAPFREHVDWALIDVREA